MTTPTAPVATAPAPLPTYADVAAIPPSALTSGSAELTCGNLASVSARAPAPPSYPQWRPPRPVCFYCGIRGHISRYCRRRQQDERRGYAEFERDRIRRPDHYYQDPYPFTQHRSPSPPASLRTPAGSHSARRRSPSPYRRSASPLRPMSCLADQHSEN